jgi:adenosylhomocysteinase
VVLCAPDPRTTQDDVAAALVSEYAISTFARSDEDPDTAYRHIHELVDHEPHLTIDHGGDVLGVVHGHRTDLLQSMLAGTEQTTAGVIRLKAMEAQGRLGIPVVAITEAQTRRLLDDRYGTGQSVLEGILRATNVLVAGRVIVICGYGWCGRGLAERARGLGGSVVVCEIDAIRALQALMDGYRVMPTLAAARIGDIFITATGNKHVLSREHYAVMKDGAILANAGHANIEIDLPALARMARAVTQLRPGVDAYQLDERRVHLIANGRLVNMVSGSGQPPDVIDIGFANQALVVEYLVRHAGRLERRVYAVPDEIDQRVARLKLDTLGVAIDELSADQERYLASWAAGA